jgi:hypothetical protein
MSSGITGVVEGHVSAETINSIRDAVRSEIVKELVEALDRKAPLHSRGGEQGGCPSLLVFISRILTAACQFCDAELKRVQPRVPTLMNTMKIFHKRKVLVHTGSLRSTFQQFIAISLLVAHRLAVRQAVALDRRLQAFQQSARQLGSSIGLLSSAYKLRQQLSVVSHLFRENAQELFPKYVKVKRGQLKSVPLPRKATKTRRPIVAILRRPTGFHEDMDAERLPDETLSLADAVANFLHHLEEFPEFADEAVHASITTFQHDLLVCWTFSSRFHG